MSLLKNAKIEFRYAFNSPAEIEKFFAETKKPRGLSFIGRSNVGKSSLINALFWKKIAKTSKTPGRTQQIIIFEVTLNDGTNFFIYDLPGYGYAKVSKDQKKQWDWLMKSFFSLISDEVLLLCLQDARHPFQNTDLGFLGFIEEYDLNAIFLFNKIDKLKTQKERSQLIKIKKQRFLGSDKELIFDVSAEKKTGLKELEHFLINFVFS